MPAISAAPTMWRPTFVGGPGLGSNLNDSMIAKSGIVGTLLAIIFPGVVIYLVQGSPSGSSASGGTHLGPGDAGDFEYRYADGRAGNLSVYLMASVLWRMLDCVSYVRGFDVDKNGVKDDSFAQHNHVIDREGGGKVLGALVQINQFAAHLDGLVGGRADREAVVPQPMTLAEYRTPAGQATFLFRFKALSSDAVGLAVHIESPATHRRMIVLLKSNTGEHWLATENNVQLIQPAYVTAATLLAGPAVDANAADITRLMEITRANRIQGHDGITVAASVDVGAIVKAVVAAIQTPTDHTTTVTVNLDDAAAERIAQHVWAPVRKLA